MLLSDELWESIEHLFPEYEPSPLGGRPTVGSRTALRVILFVLKTGISWEDAPQEPGCSGKTPSRRLVEWSEQGARRKIHAYLLAQLNGAHQDVDDQPQETLPLRSQTHRRPPVAGRFGVAEDLLKRLPVQGVCSAC